MINLIPTGYRICDQFQRRRTRRQRATTGPCFALGQSSSHQLIHQADCPCTVTDNITCPLSIYYYHHRGRMRMQRGDQQATTNCSLPLMNGYGGVVAVVVSRTSIWLVRAILQVICFVNTYEGTMYHCPNTTCSNLDNGPMERTGQDMRHGVDRAPSNDWVNLVKKLDIL